MGNNVNIVRNTHLFLCSRKHVNKRSLNSGKRTMVKYSASFSNEMTSLSFTRLILSRRVLFPPRKNSILQSNRWSRITSQIVTKSRISFICLNCHMIGGIYMELISVTKWNVGAKRLTKQVSDNLILLKCGWVLTNDTNSSNYPTASPNFLYRSSWYVYNAWGSFTW